MKHTVNLNASDRYVPPNRNVSSFPPVLSSVMAPPPDVRSPEMPKPCMNALNKLWSSGSASMSSRGILKQPTERLNFRSRT
ncbi:hypothetical protein DPMN_077263 [Dreissena polymorpha]|uniref:Uncharacterized protein n=1 Tax=Dreissena polymorpha TaxID=45954 RepID=A0A9D3YQ90_DREPO|nr:hypothetical protein DPMN_077263 [Dreissena polymorpha]